MNDYHRSHLPVPCRTCGRAVEPERECYETPTCYDCLSPPRPLPRLPMPGAEESEIEP